MEITRPRVPRVTITGPETQSEARAEKGPEKREEPSHEKKLLLNFLAKNLKEKEEAIQAKEADLECPVCLETATGEIFSCERQHMVCSRCRPRVHHCPQCRRRYPPTPLRHRYAEKDVASLQKLRREKNQLQIEQNRLTRPGNV